MVNSFDNLTIGAFAKAAGVNVETIRFYQRKGLLREPDKPYGGIRRYGERDLARLRFIKSAQWLGFTLDEVGGLLRLEDGSHCDEVRDLAERKLRKVRDKLAELKRLEAVLDELVQTLPPALRQGVLSLDHRHAKLELAGQTLGRR